MNTSAIITGTGYYLPGKPISTEFVEEKVIENRDEYSLPHGLVELITGVKSRYFANGEISSDMAAKAAMKAIENAGISPMDIDLLICASASHDISEPATANIVQEKLGCANAHVFDIKNACNSFINALDISHSLILSQKASRILVTSGEVLSPFINWKIESRNDLTKKLAALTLGDGGGACVVEGSSIDHRGILPGKFISDGKEWRLSTILAGGSLLKGDFTKMYFESDSTKLMQLALKHIPNLIFELVGNLGWDLSQDVALVIPHQVSRSIIEQICEIIKFPIERCMITIDSIGNTAAASVPIALSLAVEQGRVHSGDKILLIGGAAGFSASVLPIIL